MTPKKKVFVDVGTNQFQGYDELVDRLKIDDNWVKIFIEPNPNFIKDGFLMKKFHSIPNSVFVNAAVSESRPVDTIVTYGHTNVPGKDGPMDQGGSIHKSSGLPGHLYCPVKTVTLEHVLTNYMDCEWYFKFDCEGCEFDALDTFLEKYGDKIKFLACEFHMAGAPNEPELVAKKARMIEIMNRFGIEFVEWH